ncbi:MAG: glutathione peroxidase, partial [Bosea sp. (in: a-proteobacteria)]
MICRRALSLTAGLALVAGAGKAFAQMSPNTRAGALQFGFTGIDGNPLPLSQFAGRVLMVVNTASNCGYTPQYRGLQEVWSRYRARGLTVIGVPANDFGGQEPGTNAQIAEFCGRDYGVTFPMAGKEVVRGAGAHPFYQWASRQRPGEEPRWNFHKYLIGRDGRLIGAFPTNMVPTDLRITTAIEQ